MKMKLAALLTFVVIALAGCTAADNANATKNTNATNANTSNRTSSTETPKTSENMVTANADPTSETGGTKEGCKCSAAGMKCNAKAGEKGCCGKEGECSSMVDGKASCCASKGKQGEACCSTAGKVAMDGHENMPACGPEKKTEAAPTKKS